MGGQNPCRTNCFATVLMKQMVELNHLFQKDRGKTASAARWTVELNSTVCFKKTDAKQLARQGFSDATILNCLFQKGRCKTASAARILRRNYTYGLVLVRLILLYLQSSYPTLKGQSHGIKVSFF